jgi:thymidylate synthase (FAD)
MKNVEIQVFCIGQTQANDDQIRRWLDHIGATEYEWPPGPPEGLVQAAMNLSGPEKVIGLAAKRCYMSFQPGLNPNVTKVRKDWHDFFENILKQGHGSVMEHATYNFAIEGVSRVFTGEMNRHRAGVSISEGSMRYIRFTDIPWWIPTSLRLTPLEERFKRADPLTEEEHGMIDPALIEKKLITQRVFVQVFKHAEEKYTALMQLWDIDNPNNQFHLKKVLTSCLRRIIPMGVATGGVWTLNLRAIRHIMALRTSEAAEEEIALAISQVAKILVEKEPRLLCDFTEDAKTGAWVPKYPKI